ncbi:MAG: CatB-related O-acetyltransferase [Proteobacteria bacterium]|nr:CatB-related O-acetyltransferase [Pseudomonadota bacterium]
MGGLAYSLGRLFGAPARRSRLPGYVAIGRGTYGLDRNSFAGLSPDCPVAVGNYCSVGPDVLLLCKTDHRTDRPATYPVHSLLTGRDDYADAITRGPITIGHDVWIGARAVILSGVTIGNGAVIGAGAVVARDIAPYSINVVVPARAIRSRFSPAQISALKAIAWWNWPEARICDSVDLFDTDIDAFIAQAREDAHG